MHILITKPNRVQLLTENGLILTKQTRYFRELRYEGKQGVHFLMVGAKPLSRLWVAMALDGSINQMMKRPNPQLNEA